MFYQLFRQLEIENKYKWVRLRQATVGLLDAGQKRAFRVAFKGEGVDDHGTLNRNNLVFW